MTAWLFTAAAAVLAGLHYFVFEPTACEIRKAVLVFSAAFLGENILLLTMLWIYGLVYRADGNRQSGFCRRWCVRIAELGLSYMRVRAHISGKEKIPEGRFLFVSNHRSAFDPLSAIALLGDYNVAFITKPENLQLPILGRIAAGACYLPINRENDREALKTILKAAELIKNGVCSIAVYPEGTRSRTGKLLPFRAGAFKIAQRARAPVVIAACRGTDRVFRKIHLLGADVYLDVIGVISAEEAASMQTTELSARAEKMIANFLADKEKE